MEKMRCYRSPSFAAGEIEPETHIRVPEECSFDAFRAVYEKAYDMGLKGCSVYRLDMFAGRVLLSE